MAVSRENAQPAACAASDIAAEHAGDGAAAIDGDVDAEVDRQQRAVVPDAALRRVAVDDAPRALRVPDHLRVVVAHDRADVGDGRKDALVAAGEPRHEVRLDEAEHDPAVGLDVGAAQRRRLWPSSPAPTGTSVAGSCASWLTTRTRRNTSSPTIARSSSGRVRAMRAGAVDDHDAVERHVADLVEHPRQQPVGRQRARDVRDDDRHAVVRARPRREAARSRADGARRPRMPPARPAGRRRTEA